jgi:hypothetical protein
VTDRYRLAIQDSSTEGELFDLNDDPHELRNCWSDPTHKEIRANLTEALARAQMNAADRSPMPVYLA